MSATGRPPEIDAYVDAVREALADLPAEEREDLLEEVEASLLATAEDEGAARSSASGRRWPLRRSCARPRASTPSRRRPGARCPRRVSSRARRRRRARRLRAAHRARAGADLVAAARVRRAGADRRALGRRLVDHASRRPARGLGGTAACSRRRSWPARSRPAWPRGAGAGTPAPSPWPPTSRWRWPRCPWPGISTTSRHPCSTCRTRTRSPGDSRACSCTARPSRTSTRTRATAARCWTCCSTTSTAPHRHAAGEDDPNRRLLVTAGGHQIFNSFPIRYFEPGTTTVADPHAGPSVAAPELLTPPLLSAARG